MRLFSVLDVTNYVCHTNQPKPRGEFHMMMKLVLSNTQGVRTYLGLFQVIMANVAGRDGRGRLVGVWRRVGFKQKVNFESGPDGAATVGGT